MLENEMSHKRLSIILRVACDCYVHRFKSALQSEYYNVSRYLCAYVWMESSCWQFKMMNNVPIFHPHQWKDAKPDDLMDSKLRCVFELPSENDKVVRGAAAHY